MIRRIAVPLAAVATVVLAIVGATPAAADSTLSITPLTFDVIGLDSNDVTTGPNVYPVGARVCNTGAEAVSGLVASFVWDSSNNLIQLEGAPTLSKGSLAAGACSDVVFNVVVSRDAAAYGTARLYHITAVASTAPAVSTPTPRQLYVEQIISQNRNSVIAITGPATLTTGDTATFVVDANTATNGYEQLEAFLTLPSSIFELLSVKVTYTAPAGATNDSVYADACGWDDVPTSPTYRSCIGPEGFAGGKAGGVLRTEYVVRAVGAGTAVLSSAIYDQSGSSYHYNSDFGRDPNRFTVTVNAPLPPVTQPAPAATAPVSPSPAAPAQPATTPTTRPAPSTASGSRSLPSTGTSAALLSVIAIALISVGMLALRGSSAIPVLVPATDLERATHTLRRALYEHEDDAAAAAAWPILDRLDSICSLIRAER